MHRGEFNTQSNSIVQPVGRPPLPTPEEPIVYAKLSQNAYFSKNNKNLPEGFKVFRDCPESLRWWGYFGKSFFKVNETKKEIEFVIAHRGTDDAYAFFEDIELWLTQILPAQYKDGAFPFMQQVIKEFEEYVNVVYHDYKISYQVTGHSLGAGLAESTMIDSSAGKLRPMTGMLFENPGLPSTMEGPSIPTDYKKNTALINTFPDSINTVYRTNSDHEYHIPIDNCQYPRIFDLPLPLIPSPLYYAFPYSCDVTHPIANIVTYLESKNPIVAPMKNWPYGFLNGFDNYKTYAKNAKYWEGYIDQLWEKNGLESEILQILFDGDKKAFQDFYRDYLLSKDAQTYSSGIQKLQIMIDANMQSIFDMLPFNRKQEMLDRLPPDQKHRFGEYFQKRTMALSSKFMLEKYSLMDEFHKLVNEEISNLIEHSSQPLSPNDQKKFHALNYLLGEMTHYRVANIPLDEKNLVQDIIKETCIKFKINPYELLSFSPESLGLNITKIDFQNKLPQIKQKKASKKQPPSFNPEFLAEEYKTSILDYLEERRHSLPIDSDKYIYLTRMFIEIKQIQNPNLADLKSKIAEIRAEVSKHRELTGLKGFFNRFRDTKSLKKLNEFFDKKKYRGHV